MITYHSLQRQNRSGMNAPIAMNTGSMMEDSSAEYGSATRGPEGRRDLLPPTFSSVSSLPQSSASSVGRGGSLGTSGQNNGVY